MPAFSVIKSASRLFSRKYSATVMLNTTRIRKTKICDYQIEGSPYKPISFTVFGASREIVAQVCSHLKLIETIIFLLGGIIYSYSLFQSLAQATRKQATSEIMLGDDVLSLVVQPGIDQAFVMGLLIIFNQIFRTVRSKCF
jgi:hypothetical protein